jgi:hypothetical protein
MGRPLFFGNLGTPDHTQINMLAIKVWSCVSFLRKVDTKD